MGTTVFAGYNSGGYGNLVVVQHRLGYTTWYAHLSRITTWAGEHVEGGTRLGYVGSTGHSTGPHLHFEVRLNNVPIDPVAVPARRARPPGAAGDGHRDAPLRGPGRLRDARASTTAASATSCVPRVIARRSSALSSVCSSTPFSSATSRIVRREATASLTISVPRS